MASTSDKEVLGDMDGSKVMQVLTKNELERLTEVFKMYETGVREAAIRPTVSCDLRRPIKNVERVKRRQREGWDHCARRWLALMPSGAPNYSQAGLCRSV